MTDQSCKADLHVHSRYSHRPSSWSLKKIGCAESSTDPLYLYRLLKHRGMDMITITDHNTIDGCREIAHLENTFISEEVTTYFPEDNCKLHVLVYNITEKQHEDIAHIRKNVFELTSYLNRENIVHALAHPMYSVNGLLQGHHFARCLLLFPIFELNGGRDRLQNTVLKQIVSGLTETALSELANRYDLAPRGMRPWEKQLISGSDDHSSLYMGFSYTETAGAKSPASFLVGIIQGRATTRTHDSTPETLAHNIYSIMYQFYNQTFQINRWIDDVDLSNFFQEVLLPAKPVPTPPAPSVSGGITARTFDIKSSPASSQFLESAKSALFTAPGLQTCPPAKANLSANQDKTWLQFVNTLSDTIMRQFANDILSRLTQADLFYLFTTIGSSASLYMLLAPYFIAYSLFARDRIFSFDRLRENGGNPADLKCPSRHIAMFTDTFTEINGVAVAIQSQVKAARLLGKPLTLFLCEPDPRSSADNVAAFAPIGSFDLPEYPELKVYYPPLLKILACCYRRQFTHIHAETPGAMGLIALAVSKILGLPFRGTYHTSLPQTVRSLTGDAHLEDLFWKYIVWFYGQMERIYVPSAMTARELVAKGLPRDKLVVHQWGVNTTDFHPDKRNGFFSRRYQIQESALKLLYVGRVSQEKNLQVFKTVMQKIRCRRPEVALIIVGEGPYLTEMQTELADLPVVFTGYLTGEDLAQAYAASDIFVFPSTVDTMGNVVIEAQASGLPVIVTNKGGPSENMIDKKTGLVVPADDGLSNHLVAAILQLADDPPRMAAMKKNARRYTRSRSFENSFLRFWNNYEKPVA